MWLRVRQLCTTTLVFIYIVSDVSVVPAMSAPPIFVGAGWAARGGRLPTHQPARPRTSLPRGQPRRGLSTRLRGVNWGKSSRRGLRFRGVNSGRQLGSSSRGVNSGRQVGSTSIVGVNSGHQLGTSARGGWSTRDVNSGRQFVGASIRDVNSGRQLGTSTRDVNSGRQFGTSTLDVNSFQGRQLG